MLVLTRKSGEKVVIGDDITITVVQVDGHRVRIGIDAPPDVSILRGELAEWRLPPAAVDNPLKVNATAVPAATETEPNPPLRVRVAPR